MKILVYAFIFLPALLQANPSLLLGEWIGMNKEYRLILKFDKSKTLEIDALNKSGNSIYPQRFNYNLSNNILYIFSKSEKIDSFQIIKLEKNELLIIVSGIKMGFHKSNLKHKNLNLISVLNNHSFIVNYNQRINPDTILNNKRYQIGLRNGIACQSTEFNTLVARKINKSYVIELTINNITDVIFIDKIEKDKITGKVYLDDEIIKVEINKFDEKNKIKEKNYIHSKILGTWTWITDKSKFLDLKEKDHNTVFINYRKVQFLDNFEYIEKIKGYEYKGIWRVEQINGIWIIQYKEGGSNEWGEIRRIKSITEKYIITEGIDYCNYEGHRNSINEYYYLRN